MNLENEFIKACRTSRGKISRRLGYIDCDLSHDPDLIHLYPMSIVILSLGTGKSKGSKPHVRATAGPSDVEMYNLKSISSRTTPNRVQFLSEEGYIMTIRPDIGIVTFSGDVKGAIR